MKQTVLSASFMFCEVLLFFLFVCFLIDNIRWQNCSCTKICEVTPVQYLSVFGSSQLCWKMLQTFEERFLKKIQAVSEDII